MSTSVLRGSAADLPTRRRDSIVTRARALPRPRPELVALLALAALLNLWSLDTNGYANEYYSAAARSMSQSWHAFLYGSFDSAGVMTVDKPPLALWVQALSVRAFGLSSWSVLVPQALMGVAAVGLTYDLARRRFGRTAGFVAGLVLALTPISVAIWRHNNPDALLVLCCVAAVWFLVRGLDDGRTRWLVLCGVAIGLGFETKMAAALLVVPALAAAWLWIAPRGVAAAVRSLLAGGAAMVAVGGAWPLLVALTPAADRPWVSGTSDNSIWSLIFGYNGLGRLFGQDGGPGGAGRGGGFGGNTFFGGASGPLRLLNDSLGGQGGWLLGFALVACVGVAIATRLRRGDPRTGWIIAVGGSFATIAVAFSQAQGIFHPYYVSQLAPFTALLVGAGAALLLRADRLARVIGPLAVAAGLLCSVAILNDHPGELQWLPVVLLGGVAAAAVLLATLDRGRARTAVVAGAIGLLLLAPAVWSYQTLGHATSGTFPSGGAASQAMGGGFGGPGGPAGATGARFGGGGGGPGRGDSQSITAALAYIDAHGGGTLAVSSQSGGTGQIITQTGADLAGIGGFSGRESEVSVSWLANAVEQGQIKWVLTSGGGGFARPDGRTGSTTAMSAVEQVGAKTSVSGLYNLGGKADALRALG